MTNQFASVLVINSLEKLCREPIKLRVTSIYYYIKVCLVYIFKKETILCKLKCKIITRTKVLPLSC